MKTILATGGLGFIGSHTCVSLLNQGYKIVIIDSLVNSSIETIKKIEKISENFTNRGIDSLTFKQGDLKDFDFLDQIFKDYKKINQPINAVIHFAGLKSISESMKKPLEYWHTNVFGTLNLVKAMRVNNCFTIIFSSSATVYKPKLNQLLNENDEIGPNNPYGKTKFASEEILNDIFIDESDKWRIALLRYFNPVGAHPSGILGEKFDGNPNNLFPLIMKVVFGEQDFLSIYGKDWPTFDGTCQRDYIHVMDLADAHVEVLKYLDKSKANLIKLNIGTGIPKSVLEVVKTFEEVNNCKLPYKFTKRRKGDSPFVVADNQLAKRLLNWQPKMNLKDMCKDGLRWKQFNRKSFN